MKFALSSHQSEQYLEIADEIRVKYNDRDIIYDFIEKYPDKKYILEIPYFKNEEVNYVEIETLSKITDNLILRLARIEDILFAKELNIKWFYGTPIDTWEDLACIKNANPEYLIVGGDLFFNLPRVKQLNIPLRTAPNISNLPPLYALQDLDYDLTIIGDWFQPEAKELYEEYIDVIEFEDCDPKKESAMWRLWNRDGWPGDLQDIIINLQTSRNARLLKPDWFYKPRIDCERKCLHGSTCRSCFHQFNIANYNKLLKYRAEKEN